MRYKVLLKLKVYYSKEFEADNIFSKKSAIQNIADKLERKLLENKHVECIGIEQIGSRELPDE